MIDTDLPPARTPARLRRDWAEARGSSRECLVVPSYLYRTKRGKNVGLIGYCLFDRYTGSKLHHSTYRKECLLFAQRRGWEVVPS